MGKRFAERAKVLRTSSLAPGLRRDADASSELEDGGNSEAEIAAAPVGLSS
jgi:hypothetical protein